RRQYATEAAAGNDEIVSKARCESARRLFACLCADADFNCDVSCDHAYNGNSIGRISLVSVRYTGLYFAIDCSRSYVFTTEVDDVWKSSITKSTDDGDALCHADYDRCDGLYSTGGISTLLGRWECVYDCANDIHS